MKEGAIQLIGVILQKNDFMRDKQNPVEIGLKKENDQKYDKLIEKL